MIATFLIAFPAVLFIVDPIGVVPIFLAMTGSSSQEKCRAMALKATTTAALVLIFFAAFGSLLFQVFGITLAAFRVAGGLLLMLTALDMLKAQPPGTKTTAAEAEESAGREDIAIVPLAMPLLAGPGAIATVMVLIAQRGPEIGSHVAVVASVVLTMAITYFVLRGAHRVKALLRQTGIAIVERVLGLILAAIAVQFVFDGGKELLKG